MYIFKKSFTLIELLVVIGVVGVSLPILFGLFFIILQQQSKIYIIQEVKKNGDYTLNTIQSIIRQYGKELYSDPNLTTKVCDSANSQYSGNIYIKDKFINKFSFQLDGTKIASLSTALASGGNYGNVFLTNDKVRATSFSISCNRTSLFSPPIINISFTISQANSPVRHEEKASMTYQTKIKLRSY